jgi:hypothetical protein
MFRDLTADYTERVDIIGNQKFLDFVDDLEKLEDLKLETFELGKDPVRILTIMPLAERKEFAIGLPTLSPTLVRKKSLADEIASLEVMTFQTICCSLEMIPTTRPSAMKGMTSSPCKRLSSVTTRCQSHRPPRN